MSVQKITIPRKVLETMEALAKRRNCTIEKVLSDAVSTELHFDNKLREGYTILTQDPDTNETWRVVFTHMSDPDQMHY